MYQSRWPLTGGLLILVSTMLHLSTNDAHAAEWSLLENLSLGGIYTDNVNLVDNDSEFKESELIGVVTPSILLQGVGRRVNVDLAASLIFNTSDDNPVLPQYRALVGTELVKNNFFFDAIATADQGRINPFAAAGNPVVNRTDNFTTVYRYTLNPYFVSRLNGVADLRINYSYSDYLFEDDDVDPRTQQTLRASLFSPESSKVSGGLSASSRKTEYENDTSNNKTRSYIDAVLRYQFDRKWRFAGSIGPESNSGNSAEDRDNTNTSRWYLEARWTPNSRNSFSVRHGNRFFGNYTNLDLSHQHRKSRFILRYRTELRDPTDDLSQRNILPTTDLSGQPINPFTNGAFVQPNNFVDLTDNGAFIQDRFDAYYTLTGKKTNLELVGQYSKQDYLDSPRETIVSRAWVQVQRGLNRTYSARTRLSWSGTEEKDDNSNTETWRFLLGLSRPFGSKSGLSFQYTFADRESDTLGDSYRENRVSLFINTNYQGIPGYSGGFGRGYGGVWF